MRAFGVLMLTLAACEYQVVWEHNLRVKSFDNITLRADAVIPQPQHQGETFPVIVFANSWSCPQIEYVLDCVKFGENGYIMVEYESRGWFESGGEIDTAGPKDQKDNRVIIDWVLQQTHWNVDPTRIGVAGISYGAGIALLAAATDNRVKTAASLSGWGNMVGSLDPGFSPNLVWGGLLVMLAHYFGKPEPDLDEVWKDLLTFNNISTVENFAWERSAEDPRFLNNLQAWKTPIFMSNNFEDELFHPQDTLRFWEKLTGPKQLLLNQGTHASAELGGLIDFKDNFVWQQTLLWFEYFLKGKGDVPKGAGTVTLQLRNNKTDRIVVEYWPNPNTSTTTSYSLVPRSNELERFGKLQLIDEKIVRMKQLGGSKFNNISFGRDPAMNVGFPIMGEMFQVYKDIPILCDFALVELSHALLFSSPVFTEPARICGNVNLTIPLISNQDRWQLVGYLYASGLNNIGTLISYGTNSCWNCTAKTEELALLNFRSLCYDISAGDRLILGVDMFSEMFKPANINATLQVSFEFNASAVLHVDLMDF